LPEVPSTAGAPSFVTKETSADARAVRMASIATCTSPSVRFLSRLASRGRGQLAVDLAFDGARADCTPADELRVILAEGRVEKTRLRRHPPAGEIDHQLPREGQPRLIWKLPSRSGSLISPFQPMTVRASQNRPA